MVEENRRFRDDRDRRGPRKGDRNSPKTRQMRRNRTKMRATQRRLREIFSRLNSWSCSIFTLYVGRMVKVRSLVGMASGRLAPDEMIQSGRRACPFAQLWHQACWPARSSLSVPVSGAGSRWFARALELPIGKRIVEQPLQTASSVASVTGPARTEDWADTPTRGFRPHGPVPRRGGA